MVDVAKYTQQPDFLKKMLACMLLVPNFVSQYRDILDPEFFNTDVTEHIGKLVLDFYDKYKVVPTKPSLLAEVDRLKPEVGADGHARYTFFVMELFDDKTLLADCSYVRDSMVDHGTRQKLAKELAANFELLYNGGDIKDIQRSLSKASRLGLGQSDVGKFWFKERNERMARRGNLEVPKPIPTGILTLDRKYLNGGMHKKELMIILGSYNTFKSGLMTNIAAYNFGLGRNGVVYTLEMSEERYETRMDACSTGYTTKDLDTGGAYSAWALQSLKRWRGYTNDIVLKEYPTKQASVNTLRAHLTTLREVHGFKPDFICVDYLMLVKSDIRGDRWEKVIDIAESLRGLAQEFDVVVFAPQQLNKEGRRAVTPDGTMSSGSMEILNIADVGIIIGQTKEEKEKGEMRVIIERNRNNPCGKPFAIKINTEIMRITGEIEEDARS